MSKRRYQITDKILPERHVWHNKRCMWVSIPKNANMNFRYICTSMGMEKKLYENQSADEVFCVVRNPLTRIISGIGEYKARYKRQDTFEELLDELMQSPRSFDEHLEPQVFFINDIVFTHILKFEDINTQVRNLKYFRKNYVFHQRSKMQEFMLNKNRTQISKHFKEPLTKLITHNKDTLDKIVEKYYSYDMEIWKNPEKFIGKII